MLQCIVNCSHRCKAVACFFLHGNCKPGESVRTIQGLLCRLSVVDLVKRETVQNWFLRLTSMFPADQTILTCTDNPCIKQHAHIPNSGSFYKGRSNPIFSSTSDLKSSMNHRHSTLSGRCIHPMFIYRKRRHETNVKRLDPYYHSNCYILSTVAFVYNTWPVSPAQTIPRSK